MGHDHEFRRVQFFVNLTPPPYAQVSLKSAYLRAHYPAEFMAAVISNQGGFYSRLCLFVGSPPDGIDGALAGYQCQSAVAL